MNCRPLIPATIITIVALSSSPAADDHMFWMPPSDVVVADDHVYTPVIWREERDRKTQAVTWKEKAYLSVFDLVTQKVVTKLSLGGQPQALTRSGRFLVCSTGSELVVIDIVKPAEPEIVGRTLVHERPLHAVERVRAVDDLLFCAAGRSGLLVYRLLEDGSLERIAAYREANWGTVRSVAIDGPRVAVADTLGFALLSRRMNGNVLELKQTGYLILPQTSKSVALAGNLAVVGGSMFELHVVNIGNASQPRHVGTYKRATNYYGVSFFDLFLKNGLVHIPMGEYAYIVVDVTEPAQPRLAMEFKTIRSGRERKPNRYATSRYYKGIFVDAQAKRTYLASERNLEVVDISDMKRPKSIMWIGP